LSSVLRNALLLANGHIQERNVIVRSNMAVCQTGFVDSHGLPVRQRNHPYAGQSSAHHASITFRRKLFDHIGDWPLTNRGDFNHQPIARLTAIEARDAHCH
jgi:hypothetical protein